MKREFIFKFGIVLSLIFLITENVSAQYADLTADKEEHINSKAIYIRKSNRYNLEAVQILDSTHPYAIFQMGTDGRLLFGPSLGTMHAYLQFMQQNEKYGSINTVGENFHVDAVRQLYLSARGSTMASFDNNDINFYGEFKIHTPLQNPSATFTFKRGRNGDGAFSLTTSQKQWLRIGCNGGVALWGRDGMDTEDKPDVLISDGEVSVYHNLTANSHFYINNNNKKLYFGRDDSDTSGWIGTESNHGLYIGANNHSCMYLDPGYGVYIGMLNTEVDKVRSELKAKYRLFVKKGVLAEDYGIAPINNWSDFVFHPDYQLKDIKELDLFIKKNKHLPDVPSAEQVAKEGYSQHEMNKILLQKIEELTLYTIQQQKEIELLKKTLSEQK